MRDDDFRTSLNFWPFTSDGLQAVLDLPAGNYELVFLNGFGWFSDLGPMTATDYATTGFPVPREMIFPIKLLNTKRITIFNPAGVDSYLRRVV
jgi:hypothetical protein